MTRQMKESYGNVVEHGTDPAAMLAGIKDEIRRMESYHARAMREAVAGIRLAILNFFAAEDLSAKTRNRILNEPLQGNRE